MKKAARHPKMGISTAMREALHGERRSTTSSPLIPSTLEEKQIRARNCTQEGVRAGAKAAVIACAASAVSTVVACRVVPWAKANLNYTAQALIVSAGFVWGLVNRSIPSMASLMGRQVSVPLRIFAIVVISLTFVHGSRMDNKVLQVGEELFMETLPLQMGSRLYQLQGLKPYSWYEVKISYPASMPAIFSLQLKKGNSDVAINHQRKLLNTEKLIFKTESLDVINDQGGTYVLVSVEAEGIVAIPGVQERETILFNIVCDELLLGLPFKAWPVIFLAVLCLVLGFILPLFLPAYLLPGKEKTGKQIN